jgi:hypothetical protein
MAASSRVRLCLHDCALMPQPGLVSSPVGAPDGSPMQAPRMGSPPVAPDRLETIGYFLRERGFSEDFINKISWPQRESNLASYDTKWSVFRDWHGEHEFSPVSPTLSQFLDFLNFLFSEMKFSVQAVKGYRSAISSTLHLGSWGSNPVFRCGRKHLFVSIIEGFEREIMPATVARWIVSTIQLAYSLTTTSPDLRHQASVTALPLLFIWPILYIQRLPQPLHNSSCYWPCRNPWLFDVELATQSLSLFLTNQVNRNLVHLKRP